MRLLLALIGLVLLTAAAPTRDWTQTVTPLSSGYYLLGNPAAKVKLVEYGSFTCPHCAHFAKASDAVLKGQMIRSGSTSLELRNLVRDRLDLAAVLLARCTGPRGFYPAATAIFAGQDDWLERGYAFQQANQARLQMYPMLAQLRANADGAGLTAIARAQGMSDAAIDQCFANQTEVDRIVKLTGAIPADVDSTPTFFINGKKTPPADWTTLEPLLRAAGAR